MKAITGKIVITDKINFEPDGLPSPKVKDFHKMKLETLAEYEASKQLIEVENVFWGELCECWFYDDEIGYEIGYKVIDNQPCKANIKNNKATIIELL